MKILNIFLRLPPKVRFRSNGPYSWDLARKPGAAGWGGRIFDAYQADSALTNALALCGPSTCRESPTTAEMCPYGVCPEWRSGEYLASEYLGAVVVSNGTFGWLT